MPCKPVPWVVDSTSNPFPSSATWNRSWPSFRAIRTRSAGVGVLRGVVQRLEATEVHRRLDRLRISSVGGHVDCDTYRCLPGLRLEGRPQSLVGEERRIDPAGKIPKIIERRLCIALDRPEQARTLAGVPIGELLREPSFDGQGNQLLLGPSWRLRSIRRRSSS
jgi:hypothetical protein